MKRFLLKSALLVLALCMLLFLMGWVYTSTGSIEIVYRGQSAEQFLSMPDSIDIAVFGNSAARFDILYPPEGKNMFVFALPNQTPVYDLAMMDQYRDRIRPGALVIAVVTDLTLYYDDDDDREEFEEKQARYYWTLDADHIQEIDRPYYYLRKIFPVLGMEPFQILRCTLVSLGLRELDLRTVEKLANKKLADYSATDMEELKEDAEKNHVQVIARHFPDGNPVMIDALRRMMEMAEANQWNMVLISTPFSNASNDQFPEDYYPAWSHRAQELAAEYGIPFLDYSHDAAWGDRTDLFADGVHLNDVGSQKFCQQLFGDLKVMGLLDG